MLHNIKSCTVAILAQANNPARKILLFSTAMSFPAEVPRGACISCKCFNMVAPQKLKNSSGPVYCREFSRGKVTPKTCGSCGCNGYCWDNKPPPTNPIKPCKFGPKCTNRGTCTYYHDHTGDGRPSVTVPLWAKSACRFGPKCTRRETCTYYHDPTEDSRPSVSLPPVTVDIPCRNLFDKEVHGHTMVFCRAYKKDFTYRDCPFGQNCKYRHFLTPAEEAAIKWADEERYGPKLR